MNAGSSDIIRSLFIRNMIFQTIYGFYRTLRLIARSEVTAISHQGVMIEAATASA